MPLATTSSVKPSTQIPPWPSYSPEEIEAVSRVLESGKVNYWTGDEARAFEREFAESVGCGHAIALCNGTSALELAIHALGIPSGSEIVTSPRTFIASASCAVMQGCRPVLADVDPVSQNISAESIEKVLTEKTRAIIPVHLAGWPCDMDPIMALAERRGLKVIEDCAQANGATYKGRPVGSLGHAAAFSFCQDKIITTGGEGGMLTTRDKSVWEKAWSFKDHGKNWDAVYHREHAPGFRWLHESFGTNWRMTEMQAAIGRIQLGRLPEWTRLRRRNLARWNDALSRFPSIRITPFPPEIGHAAYKAYAFIRPEHLKDGWSRDRIMTEISARQVPCFSGSCSEIYLEQAFTRKEWQPDRRLPVAKELGETSLMFLVHPPLTPEHLDHMIAVTTQVLERATR
ncbi:DegT/DnrJ/EryC1/StrS family aminotransferase [Holophaga foetida]|uniref:DegT/DnrJ/EryC1/StrS family aminotransferase n=1 Tax=Holophaga foetida TaxID=35839 RepID=UPI0002473B7F|nr:DegT/DnrJ/EryC1/StrS aminotransferase family protein [Holophaga foetida]